RNQQHGSIRIATELVAIDRRVAETEVCLDAVPGTGPVIAVVLNQVELHQCWVGDAGRVQFDAGDVVLNVVVEDLVAALGTGETGVRPDASAKTGGENGRIEVGALDREPVKHHLVSLNLHWSAGVVDD